MKRRINTIENARKLRKQCTKAEEILWSEFRNRKFKNLKIRRQHPIGRYVVDFYCYEKQLIIEVDGSIHDDIEQSEYDINRETELESAGNRIVRLRNEEVINNVKVALEKIVV